jgi:hypothetical protein
MPEEIVISDFSDEELREEVTRRGMESEALEPRASELLEAIAGAHEGRAGAATEAMSILIDIVPSIASERGAALDLARLRPEGYWNAGQGR